jgi:ATP-dependent Zn protease
MYVVCGQRGKLYVTIEENLEQFIDDDLFWFQLILLFFNILIFIAFLFFFESRLQARVTKPI